MDFPNACKNGEINVVENYLHHGIYNACLNNHTDILKLLIPAVGSGYSLYYLIDEYRYTILHYTCNRGYAKIVEILLNDPECNLESNNNKNQYTAMHCACLKNHVKIIKMLINAGADTEAKDKNGKTPLELCDDKTKKLITLHLAEYKKTINKHD